MTKITFNGGDYQCQEGETVLECLMRHDVEVPHSCQGGTCQTCMMRAVDGTPPQDAQTGLKPTLQDQNYFLACICRPEQDMSVAVAGDEVLPKFKATVIARTPMNFKMLRLRLKYPAQFQFRAGQFLNLYREDGLIRSYSIASMPDEGYIELHIEHIDSGEMSGWLHTKIYTGDQLTFDGPHGDCYYLDGNPDQNLLLVSTGSGLAPLWGIAREALAKGHKGEIHLFHGSRSSDKLYLVNELEELADEYPNFFYTPCISGQQSSNRYTQGRANDIALQKFPKLDGWRIYLCGHPAMVNDTKRRAFLAGADLQQIYADPFTFAE